jgi:hypothetical protein
MTSPPRFTLERLCAAPREDKTIAMLNTLYQNTLHN